MKTINKFDTFDELDDFDKMLFDYYKTQDENIPLSTQNAIKNAFNDKHKSNSISFVMLKKVAVFILALGIVTTTTVYAKDIVNFIANIFADNNRGIDTAIDNGYVQNVDMDYVVCNDIGVKVDYLVMDDKNLNISFVYKYFGEEAEIESIKFGDLTITDEDENMLCLVAESTANTNSKNSLGIDIQQNDTQHFIDNTTIKDSILVISKNFPKSSALSVKINQMILVVNNTVKHIEGDWSFIINLNNNFIERKSYKYISTESPYVNKLTTSLTDTSLSIELQLNTLFCEDILYSRNTIILKDEYSNIYRPTEMLSQNYTNTSTINLLYPITTYDNIEQLYLQINLNQDEQINLNLIRN